MNFSAETINWIKLLKTGDFSAKYFLKTRDIIRGDSVPRNVELQFFHREESLTIAGIELVKLILQINLTDEQKKQVQMWAVPDGALVKKGDPVIKLIGRYEFFGIYEGIIDGVLARCSGIASRSKEVVDSTTKPVIFMADRNDWFANQEIDAYAAFIGGMRTFVTNRHKVNEQISIVGTMPHALIQMYDGDIVAACDAYMKNHPGDSLTALIDFNNDVITDTIKVVKRFQEKLTAVRIDTSENMLDEHFVRTNQTNNPNLKGVSAELVCELKKALISNGGKHVKIVVTSGFTPKKIQDFEHKNVPVDVYGVGSYLTKYLPGFTGDLVKLNGKKVAKKGRESKDNSLLNLLEL